MNLVLKQISADVFLMKFNPWNFTNQNELITDFFASLQSVLIKNGSKELRKTLGRYAGKLK
jgi:predicted KAP-like P-loop ATPase